MNFAIGDRVKKINGQYGGPGVVRGVFAMENKNMRYVVAHRIEGGWGEMLHIYSKNQLALESADEA
jgi:hypothetical protein